MRPLLWCDIETTGLSTEDHALIEIGLVATNKKLEIEDEITCMVKHDGPLVWAAEARALHEASGLVESLQFAELSLVDAERKLVAWVGARFAGRPLASSSPLGVDFPFIEKFMPRLRECFHPWRIFDVRTLLTFFGERKTSTVAHRSLADLHQDIAIVRRLRGRVV